MDQLTQQNAANAEETASASEELSAQAQNMKEQVDQLSLQVGSKADDEVSYTHQNSFTPPSNKSRKRGLNRDNGDFQEQVKPLESSDELIPMGAKTSQDQKERFKGF
jgi:methyl-accepting chemotaxis protein